MDLIQPQREAPPSLTIFGPNPNFFLIFQNNPKRHQMPNKLNEQNTISISTSHPPNPTMVDASPQTLTPLPSPAAPSVAQPPPPPSPPKGFIAGLPRRPAVRVTSEYDSDTQLFLHKASCKLFEGFAKLKLSFQNNREGEISYPQIGFLTKYLSVLYDLEDRNALVKGSFDVGRLLQFKSTHDVKAQQGEAAVIASLGDPLYKLELVSTTPAEGLPRATFRFPHGEIMLEEKQEDEVKRVLSINGILKGQLMNGVCTAQYKDNDLNLRYCYKDEEMTFIPTISLPSNAVSFAFKRRFSPFDKLSYSYNLDSNYWNTVYKHTVGKDLKFKAGYDSEVRLGWASLWVGDEDGKAKTAPMKMKVQFMVQVPQDDIGSSMLMFRVKKRWDF
ncbi:hypothetical protein QJS04_geneDACA006132 [Acorus gramineus]|uniref:Outer envelope pore protein 37, chloroplastic n=1 Tax=Acorus gramineus TaxID=55184 RepID=A0AAV9B2S3_ACOGR|nr:hypothetical protein QJS04_geneDACA006132 [Acorus gramineus]